jgi:anti-sigma regulatory factor (Ser/Thr protein kinase)
VQVGPGPRSDLVLAINELGTNAVRHGGGHGVLCVWPTSTSLICQIRDAGHITDPLAGRRAPVPESPGGVGLWAVNPLCDLVEIRSSPAGTTVRGHLALG